jgi:hypothetical protein
MSPFALFNLHMQVTILYWDAHTVVTLRLMGMSGAIAAHPGENQRMMDEKPQAWMESYIAGAQAAFAGKTPDVVMNASLLLVCFAFCCPSSIPFPALAPIVPFCLGQVVLCTGQCCN